MASQIFRKVGDIKRRHPDVAKEIDKREREIRRLEEEINRELRRMPEEDRKLVQVFVVNGLHRTVDEVFL